jgi:hypothetical protein
VSTSGARSMSRSSRSISSRYTGFTNSTPAARSPRSRPLEIPVLPVPTRNAGRSRSLRRRGRAVVGEPRHAFAFEPPPPRPRLRVRTGSSLASPPGDRDPTERRRSGRGP